MSISSTGLYGSETIVNTDIFDDVQTLKKRWSLYRHHIYKLLKSVIYIAGFFF